MDDLQKCGNTRGSAESRPSKEGLSILIVDDDPDMRAYVRHCLKYLDDQVADIREAADGIEALELALHMAPTLVISYVVMPLFDGYELCKALKTSPDMASVQVLLISGESNNERTLNAGADAFLGKPFNAVRMRTCLDKMLGNEL